MRPILVAVFVCATTLPAFAATTGAWEALDRDARAACGREVTKLASKARVSGVAGRILGIGMGNDGDRYYALVLRGTTARAPSQWLCLYDKRAKTAAAREIETR